MMKQLVLAAALCPLVAAAACKKEEKAATPAEKPGPTATGTQPGPTAGAAKPLPGTENLHSLLSGAGKSAAPSKGSLGGLGGILGGVGGGQKAGGGGLGLGAIGGGAADKAPAAAADDDKPAAEEAAAEPPAKPVAMPPPGAAGGDCAAVAQRIGALMRAMVEQELGDMSEEERKMAETMVDGMIAEVPKQIQQLCNAQKWPQDLRDCLLTAKDLDSLDACEKYVTPEMQAGMEGLGEGDEEAPAPTGPAPKWDGAKNDCGAVGDHVVALAKWQMSGAPADQREMAEGMMAGIKDQIAQACEAAGWSETARLCVLRATSVEAIDSCSAQLAPAP